MQSETVSTPEQPQSAPGAGEVPPSVLRRRSLASVALFVLVVALVAEGAVRLIASDLTPPQRWSVPEAQRKEDQLRNTNGSGGVLFLGASGVDAAADPIAIGGRGYNAALQGASIEMIALWANEVGVPKFRPSTVVIGLSPIELTPHDQQRIKSTKDFIASPRLRELRVERICSTSSRSVRQTSAACSNTARCCASRGARSTDLTTTASR